MLYFHFPFFLDHSLDKLVDFLSTVTSFSTLKEVNELGLVGESSTWAGKLERPQKVVRFLEVRSHGGKFVDKVGTALDTDGSNALFNDRVVGNGDALLVKLSESTLVDKLLDGLTGRVAVGHVWLDKTEHTDGRLVKLDKSGVVDLTKTEELHDLLGLGRDTDSTPDTDDQGDLGHRGDKKSTLSLSFAPAGDGRVVGGLVLGSVLFSVGDGIFLILTLLLPGIVGSLLGLSGELGLGGLLLENGFGDLGCHFDSELIDLK